MFSDALSPGGSGKKAPGCHPDVHLGRRSLVPETRSGKKRKQVTYLAVFLHFFEARNIKGLRFGSFGIDI
jgi:hypothetical protein